MVVLCRELRGAGFGAEPVLVACPVGGWREGERPASRGAACNRGRGVRAVSWFSAAQPSRNRCAAVPRAAASSCRLAAHHRSLPGASLHPCPGAAGRPGFSAGSDHKWPLGGRSAFGAGRPPLHRVPLTPCSPSRRRRPFPCLRCAACGRSGVRAGAGRRSSGAAGGGALHFLQLAALGGGPVLKPAV